VKRELEIVAGDVILRYAQYHHRWQQQRQQVVSLVVIKPINVSYSTVRPLAHTPAKPEPGSTLALDAM
jgi:hypothetical protein